MTKQFNELNLPEFLLKSLERLKMTTPTPIQEAVIPLAIEGRDVLATAETGSGKTLAYLLPLLTRICESKEDTALILAPTRELAIQIKEAVFSLFDKNFRLPIALIIGGDPMGRQLDQIARNPRIIVATPGRLEDHLRRMSIKLNKVKAVVFDEIDRMLEMGFSDSLEMIFRYIPAERQTLMFSATLPNSIVSVANKYLNNHERIAIGSVNKPVTQVEQEVVKVNNSTKFSILLERLQNITGSVIIFVKTKIGAEDLTEKLRREKIRGVDLLHGGLRQRRREQVVKNFRDYKFTILVTTDVSARGLDIPHIEYVINYDLPMDPGDYIHRIGRTGRAGKTGFAISFIAPDDYRRWDAINRLINHNQTTDFKRSGANNNNSSGGSGSSNSGGGSRRKFGSSRRSGGGGNFGRSSDNGGRSERFGRSSDNGGRSERFERSSDNGGRSERFGRSSENSDRSERFGRSSDNGGRSERFGRSSDNGGRSERFGRSSSNDSGNSYGESRNRGYKSAGGGNSSTGKPFAKRKFGSKKPA